MNDKILEIIIYELRLNKEMSFMDIVRKVWDRGVNCKQQTVANILHIHCVNHKRLRKKPYFEKVKYGVWKLYDNKNKIENKSIGLVEEKTINNKLISEERIKHTVIKEIHNFFKKYKYKDIDFYGEAELQLKLGWHFMQYLPNFIIQVERPISEYGINKKLNKKEIDIVLIDKSSNEKYLIELKSHFYRQSAYNKRIYFTLKDIEFLERLKETNVFKMVASVCFTESHYYYEIPEKSNAQYSDFRRFHRIKKGVYTLTKECDVNIKNNYEINWIKLKDNNRYYVIEV